MRLCDHCFRRHWRAKIDKKTGRIVTHKNGNRVFICIFCGNVQEEDDVRLIPKAERLAANVLYLDIETSGSVYRNYGARVPSKFLRVENLMAEWYMIAWTCKYLDNDTVLVGLRDPGTGKGAG